MAAMAESRDYLADVPPTSAFEPFAMRTERARIFPPEPPARAPPTTAVEHPLRLNLDGTL
jgi:hypothetical protein